MVVTALDDVRTNWESFGERDPLWGVYSRRTHRGGGWDEDAFFRTGHDEIAELDSLVERFLPGQRHDDALDFGCGVGRLTQPLAERFGHVVGVDISRPMLEHARRYDPAANIDFVLNTAEDLAVVPDESVDFVLTHIVLQHMPPALAKGYLAEFFRVLRPGGGLVFTLPSVPAPTRRGLAYQLLPNQLIFRAKKLRDKAVMQMNAIRHDELVDYLEGLGFEVRFLQPSKSAGPNWLAFRYFIRKPEIHVPEVRKPEVHGA